MNTTDIGAGLCILAVALLAFGLAVWLLVICAIAVPVGITGIITFTHTERGPVQSATSTREDK